MQPVQIVQIQIRVAQTDTRKEGVVLPEIAMCCDVDNTALGTPFPQHFQARLGSHKKFARWDCSRNRANLLKDVWSRPIGNAKNQTRPRRVRLPGMAQSVDARTGSVGDREGIHKILFAVEQGLKGQIMQHVMGHENQMASLYTPA